VREERRTTVAKGLPVQDAAEEQTLHISVFGRPNSGKSSLINALAGASLADVSATPGTTGEAGYLSAELAEIGAVTFIDTPGLCEGTRVNCRQFDLIQRILSQSDMAILAIDSTSESITSMEHQLIRTIEQYEIPNMLVLSRSDLAPDVEAAKSAIGIPDSSLAVSTKENTGFTDLMSAISEQMPEVGHCLISDMITTGSPVLFVTPDEGGDRRKRMLQLHYRMVREVLGAGCMPLISRETDLPLAMTTLNRPPGLVVVDTENLDRVANMIPPDIPLTSTSLVMAREKGDLREFAMGFQALSSLRPGDRVLVAEACNHRPLSEQASFLSLPTLLQTIAGGPLRITDVCGSESFPQSVSGFQLVLHCAGCDLTRPEMLSRQAVARRDEVPMINHGILRSLMSRALPRAFEPFIRCGAIDEDAADKVVLSGARSF